MNPIAALVLGFAAIWLLNQPKGAKSGSVTGRYTRGFPGSGRVPTNSYAPYPPTLTGTGSTLTGAGNLFASIASVFKGSFTRDAAGHATVAATVPSQAPIAGSWASGVFSDPTQLAVDGIVPVQTAIAQGTDNTFDPQSLPPSPDGTYYTAFDGAGSTGYQAGSGGYPEGNAAGLGIVGYDPASDPTAITPLDLQQTYV